MVMRLVPVMRGTEASQELVPVAAPPGWKLEDHRIEATAALSAASPRRMTLGEEVTTLEAAGQVMVMRGGVVSAGDGVGLAWAGEPAVWGVRGSVWVWVPAREWVSAAWVRGRGLGRGPCGPRRAAGWRRCRPERVGWRGGSRRT